MDTAQVDSGRPSDEPKELINGEGNHQHAIPLPLADVQPVSKDHQHPISAPLGYQQESPGARPLAVGKQETKKPEEEKKTPNVDIKAEVKGNNGEGPHSGKWSEEEHERLLEGLHKYGNQWVKVCQYVQTRTAAQIRSHAQKHFAKLRQQELKKLTNDPTHPKKFFIITREYINHTPIPATEIEVPDDAPRRRKRKGVLQPSPILSATPPPQTIPTAHPVPEPPFPFTLSSPQLMPPTIENPAWRNVATGVPPLSSLPSVPLPSYVCPFGNYLMPGLLYNLTPNVPLGSINFSYPF